MARTITRLYDNRNDALEAAHELERMGIKHEDVSIIASNKDRWYDGDRKGKRHSLLVLFFPFCVGHAVDQLTRLILIE